MIYQDARRTEPLGPITVAPSTSLKIRYQVQKIVCYSNGNVYVKYLTITPTSCTITV
jgi:hypothetical protein